MNRGYSTTKASKIWGLVYLTISFVVIYLIVYAYQLSPFQSQGLIPMFVTITLFILLIFAGLNHIFRTIVLHDDVLTYIKFLKWKSVHLKDMKCIEEGSYAYIGERVDHRLFGVPIIGKPWHLAFHARSGIRSLLIRNIRSIKNFEELYKEIEKITGKKINRNIKTWEKGNKEC